MGSAASVESVKPGLATAPAAIEDAITCCICFNVYRDPHALPCLHTLCKPCIDQLAVRGKVECPECRESSYVKNIRKDFKTQSLIDAQIKSDVGAVGSKTDKRSLMSNGYLKLIPNRYELSGAQDSDSNMGRIYIIQNQIWCTGEDGIQIYDKNMRFIKRIKHDYYYYVTALAEWNGDIIVACDDDSGIHHIKHNGKYVKQISNSSFSDITTNGRYVYGLQRSNPSKIVIIFSDESYNWTEIGEIPLNTTCYSYDKLIANTNSLFLSLYGNSCIQKYSLEGKLQQTFGNDGTGALSGPILCSVDVYQNLLVADVCNAQLKVYNSEKKEWHVVPLELYLSPCYAVTDEKNIWVLTDTRPSKILKFTQI